MKNISFIDTLVDTLPATTDLSDHTFVFPNRRAGLFFIRAISKRTYNHGAILLPKVYDINRFVESKSKYTKADDTELLIWLYKAYTEVDCTNTDHKISNFIELGTKILHDFNEIDKYMVDAEKLFQNVNDLNNLTANNDTDVRHFYQTLLASNDDSPLLFHQRFSALWNVMYPLYTRFRKLLNNQGIAYEGMIFRELCRAEDELFNEQKITFAGFNILTETERQIMERYPNRRMVFDYNCLHRDDTEFDYKSVKTSDFHFSIPDRINAYPCMTSANQALALNSVLSSLLITSEAKTIEKNTAVILADESLLTEVLSNIPKEIEHLNITMGYPLADTQIATFINNVIKMQLSMKPDYDGILKVYHKPLTDVLLHPYIHFLLENGNNDKTQPVQSFINEMVSSNKIKVPVNDLASLNCPDIFVRNANPFDYLKHIFTQLESAFTNFNDAQTICIDSQFIAQYNDSIDNLRKYLEKSDIHPDEAETYSLIHRLTRNLKAQFRGEPLSGLQIMGLLECRLLDFDNTIFVGFNDNFVPGSSSLNNSIIPYSLRRPYGLPSFEITNSIYSYNFYRMLHRCSRLDLIYNTATSDKSKCEVSRFYNQLQYIYGKRITTPSLDSNICIVDGNKNIFSPYMLNVSQPIQLKRALSASALKHFITCPLRFYYEFVLELRQPDELEDIISERNFGNLLHKAMELYYSKLKSMTATLDKSAQTILINRVCEEAFRSVMKYDKHNQGYDILAFNSLRNLVTHIIKFDESCQGYTNVKTEYKVKAADSLFSYSAVIDRIDAKDNTTDTYNIIDYKTSIDDNYANLDKMFDRSEVKRIDLEVMQVLFYCYIMNLSNPERQLNLTPYLFKVYSFSLDKEKKLTPMKVTIGKEKIEINTYNDVKDEFETLLKHKLEELHAALQNPEQFRTTASNAANCDYCPFSDLCMRNY